jgi:hypothetical protein
MSAAVSDFKRFVQSVALQGCGGTWDNLTTEGSEHRRLWALQRKMISVKLQAGEANIQCSLF